MYQWKGELDLADIMVPQISAELQKVSEQLEQQKVSEQRKEKSGK